MKTLVWTRGEAFPLDQLATDLKCPRCGNRKVQVVFEVPNQPRESSDNKISYSDSDVEPPASAWRLPLISFAIQASLRCHLWTFWHAGQRSGIDKPSNESNTIASELRPARTGFPNTGQRIKISGIG
jgi:hypothetical protein